MTTEAVKTLAAAAGCEVPEQDLEALRAFLEECFAEFGKLRELELPDELEPATRFAIEAWR